MYIYIYIYNEEATEMATQKNVYTDEATEMAAKYLQNKKMCF